MAPAKQHLNILLLLLICSYCAGAAAMQPMLNTTAPCLPDQASSLLQLKRSFIGAYLSSWQVGTDCAYLSSWQAGTDCCHWEGVICDTAFGRVISLDLGGFQLMSRHLDPALFNLTSLRNLNLAFNDFANARLPASGFERLTDIIHLNLSGTNFIGQIPIGMVRLTNLVTLDFSGNFGLYFQVPSFQTFMANMSNLRELYLDSLDLSNSGSTWSTVLADSVPQLQILSLSECGISGSIHPSFSRLRSLTVINFPRNRLTGKFPEYFSELSSLSVLDISLNNFEGQFPTKIFQLKSLRTLDLSENQMLSVRLTYFPDRNNLETLGLAWTNISYGMPLSFANLKSLKTLCLSTVGIAKELSSLVMKIPSLHDLQLEGSILEKPVLSWVGNLKTLKYLSLSGYDFSHLSPTWIGNLTGLESLVTMDCSFSEPIPYQIGNLENLIELEFDSCDFSGQGIPSWIGNLTKLTSLVVTGCNFSGPIPSTIGNMVQLEDLQFTMNNISGKIPKSLFALPALQHLILNQNQFSGSLEDIAAPLSSPLLMVQLQDNRLTGPIPKSFFQLRNLQYLNLESNNLTGTIELNSIWGLKSLNFLSLSNNMIMLIDKEGDAAVFPSLPNITYLYLASCNLTELPASFRYLNTLLELDLSKNQIKGAIPSWVWENWKYHLNSLDLSHNMFSTLEKSPSLVHMKYLNFLDLSFNELQGSIPIPVTSSEKVALDYSNNNFSSIMPNFGRYVTSTVYINLSKNRLSGHIPLSFCSLNKLEMMDLSYNHFSGPIPSCLIERGSLSMNVLKLRKNKLHGMLPKNIRKGCKLRTIDLNGNRIEGTLPRSLANCQDLELLDVGNNQIVGSFPSWMDTLPNLQVLVLRSNKLNGTIRDLHSGHQRTNHFTGLQIIDLASNHFSGDLHSEWFENLKSMMNNSNGEAEILEHYTQIRGKWIYKDTVTVTYKKSEFSLTNILSTFKVIDFSNNSFVGPIPESIGSLISLHGLNMSYNHFTGQIPSQLGDLTRLESMDLSWNHLWGEIPEEFTSLTSLAWLNLSYNNLTGRIPQGNQFLSFPASSFEGNAGLCGIQLSNKQCDTPGPDSTTPSTSADPERNTLWQGRLDAIILFMFAGLGFGAGFALAIIFRRFCHVKGWTCKHM